MRLRHHRQPLETLNPKPVDLISGAGCSSTVGAGAFVHLGHSCDHLLGGRESRQFKMMTRLESRLWDCEMSLMPCLARTWCCTALLYQCQELRWSLCCLFIITFLSFIISDVVGIGFWAPVISDPDRLPTLLQTETVQMFEDHSCGNPKP